MQEKQTEQKSRKTFRDIENDDDIQLLVHTFYAKVEKDERLGYIFNDVASVDWDEHLPRMIDFWSNLLFQTRRYSGYPLRKHMPLPIEKNDFNRWYTLFDETVNELFTGEKADRARELAARIASTFLVRMEDAGKFDKDQNRY